MKRMSVKFSQTDHAHTAFNSDEHQSSSCKLKTKSSQCRLSIRKAYILLVILVVLVLWIFIYYKVLNHPFELPEPLNKLREMFGDGKVKKRRGREEETETVIISPMKPCWHQFQKDRNPEVIHFAIVACLERYEDALVNMKSITLLTNFNVFFHIFTDKRHIKEKTFEKELKTWPGWKEQWMMFNVYPIRLPVTHKIDWLHLFKPCASQRLFLANNLSDVDSLIYVDTDILFLDAPENLWSAFKMFNESQIAGLVPECDDNTKNCHYNSKLNHPYFEPHALNSGVMLMNLTGMRKINWEETLIEIYLKYKYNIVYGDQDLLNIYFQSQRNQLYNMSCHWNYRPDHCMHGNTCDEADKHGVSVLHGNRQVFKQNHLQPEFYVIYEAFRKFRFKDSLQSVVVDNVRKILNSPRFLQSHCGRMAGAFLKHLTCPIV